MAERARNGAESSVVYSCTISWTWCQGGGWPWLVAGTTTTMDVDLNNLDCQADLSQVHALYIYFGNSSTGTFYVDNARAE